MSAIWTAAFGITAAGLTIATVTPHLYIKKTRQWYSRKDADGKLLNLPEDTKLAIDEVLEDLKVPEEKIARINLCNCRGLDPLVFGSNEGLLEALLAFPGSFRDRDHILENLRQEPSLKTCEQSDLLALAKSMTLTSKAEKFVIARQIFGSNDVHTTLHIISPLLFPSAGCLLANFMFVQEVEKKRTIPLRRSLSFTLWVFSIVATKLLQQLVRVFSDQSVDAKASRVGKDYAQGAVEYYSQLAERDLILSRIQDAGILEKYALNSEGKHTGCTYYSQSVSPSKRLQAVTSILDKIKAKERSNGTGSAELTVPVKSE